MRTLGLPTCPPSLRGAEGEAYWEPGSCSHGSRERKTEPPFSSPALLPPPHTPPPPLRGASLCWRTTELRGVNLGILEVLWAPEKPRTGAPSRKDATAALVWEQQERIPFQQLCEEKAGSTGSRDRALEDSNSVQRSNLLALPAITSPASSTSPPGPHAGHNQRGTPASSPSVGSPEEQTHRRRLINM